MYTVIRMYIYIHMHVYQKHYPLKQSKLLSRSFLRSVLASTPIGVDNSGFASDNTYSTDTQSLAHVLHMHTMC